MAKKEYRKEEYECGVKTEEILALERTSGIHIYACNKRFRDGTGDVSLNYDTEEEVKHDIDLFVDKVQTARQLWVKRGYEYTGEPGKEPWKEQMAQHEGVSLEEYLRGSHGGTQPYKPVLDSVAEGSMYLIALVFGFILLGWLLLMGKR